MGDKKQFGVRLPQDSAEAVEEYTETNDVSQADAMRRAIDAYFVEDTPSDTGRDTGGDSALERGLATLAAVLLGGGIVLAADGSSGVLVLLLGLSLAVAHGTIVRTVRTTSAAVRELENPRKPGALRYIWSAMKGDTHAPRNPSGIVERAAWLDLYGIVLIFATGVAMIPLAAGVFLSGAGVVVGAVGANLVLWYLGGLSVSLSVATLMIAVATVAQIAVGSGAGSAVEGRPAGGKA